MHLGPAKPVELVAALELLFRHLPEGEKRVRMAAALPLLREAARHKLRLTVARDHGRIHGAGLGQALPGRVGLIWPPQSEPGSPDVEDLLIREGEHWLIEQGSIIIQSLLTPEETILDGPLRRAGYLQPTRLETWSHSMVELPELPALAMRPFSSVLRPQFLATLSASHAHTLDFPELNGLHSGDDLLAGHRPQETANRWWLTLEGEIPMGVLMLGDGDRPDEWELGYVGVIPEFRGRGFGRKLVNYAIRAARSAGCRRLTVGVDARNGPAKSIYRTCGFAPVSHREVYFKIHRPAE